MYIYIYNIIYIGACSYVERKIETGYAEDQ